LDVSRGSVEVWFDRQSLMRVLMMPYVKREIRRHLAKWLDGLILNLVNLTSSGTRNSGVVTYVIYKILVDIYGRGNYERRSNALKVLESVKLEFYRKILAPYEDKKAEENGDIRPSRRK